MLVFNNLVQQCIELANSSSTPPIVLFRRSTTYHLPSHPDYCLSCTCPAEVQQLPFNLLGSSWTYKCLPSSTILCSSALLNWQIPAPLQPLYLYCPNFCVLLVVLLLFSISPASSASSSAKISSSPKDIVD